MKILFIMLHPGYIRYYVSTIRLLAKRDHIIHLGFNIPNIPQKQVDDKLAEKLSKENPKITFSTAPNRSDFWRLLSKTVRIMMDYLRYLHPRYKNAPKLRKRIEGYIPPIGRTSLRIIVKFLGIQPILKCLKIMEKTLPCDKQINNFILNQKPDVILVSPLIDFGSDQVDYLKSAKSMGIKNALCVGSWDNLTNKGLIRIEPDRVIVWNDIQKSEAVDLHGITPSNVVITGAQCFDEWFERKPSTTKDEFHHKVGLPLGKQIILYLCSSPFVSANNEAKFVEEWIKKIRDSSDSKLRDAGILIRPHPLNTEQWKNVDSSHLGNVVIFPQQGSVPIEESAKSDFFDSLHHCSAVVGLNTSAFIEAGILGRPSYSILCPEFKNTQEGTLHFHYLVEGGLLHVSDNFKEHLNQLSKTLDGNSNSEGKIRDFINSFVRPHGIDVACTPILADAIERLGKSGPGQRESTTIWTYSLRFMLFPLIPIVFLVERMRNAKKSK